MARSGQTIECYVIDLYRYARAFLGNSIEADELVQESLARALAQPNFWSRIKDPRAYLFAILHNVNVDGLNARRRHPRHVELGHLDAHVSSPPSQAAALELRDLRRGLSQLPSDQREVVLLVGLEGLSYRQTADILSIPLGTVMSRLSRGREALRQFLEGKRCFSAASARSHDWPDAAA